MKPLLALALLFTGCTEIPTQHGKVRFCGDYQNVRLDDGSVHFAADVMTHSSVIHAYGSAGGRLIGAAAAGLIGYKAVQAGQDAVGVLAAVAPVHYNRQTSRATPKPSTLLHP